MEATLQPNNGEKAFSGENSAEKSELMQIFESHVHDAYWAYKDLLTAIFEPDQSNGDKKPS